MGGKRGENAFRRSDAIRALQSARDAGLEVTAMEIILDLCQITFIGDAPISGSA